MTKHIAIKNYFQETRLFQNRALASLIIVTLFSLVLIVRLGFLQLKKHQFYSTLSRQNLLSIIPVEPNRGLIYDRNGVLLAKNLPTYTLSLVPNNIENLDLALSRLSKIIPLTQQEKDQFHRILHQYRPYQPVPLKFKLTEEEVAKFYVNQYQLPGVLIQTKMMRAYPLGSTTGNVTGYVGRVNQNELQKINRDNYAVDADIGKVGIEKYYEKILHGKIGFEEAEMNANGRIVRELDEIPPKPGDNIYLTIDSQLQTEAENALGDESGAIVVMQPQTGEILAMITKPNFDPNLFAAGVSQKEYQRLLHSSLHPLYNRVIRGQYASGSTIKPFFALTGLDNGVITPQYQIYDPGWFQLPKTTHIYHDWKEHGHGWVNITKAIMVSCDTYFYNLAVNLGINRLDNALYQFGFGNLTGIDMPEEVPGLVPTPQWKMGAQGHPWYTGDTIETGIGQGFLLVTPIQLAQAVATIANRGKRFKPHLLFKTVSPQGVTTETAPIAETPVILTNPKNWDIVIHAMQSVVDNGGTAYYFGKHAEFTVAAKTGTAQVYGQQRDEEDNIRTNIPKQLRDNHLFIAFAPVDNPQIAIAIVIEHSAMADRIASQIMRYYFQNQEKPTEPAPHEQ